MTTDTALLCPKDQSPMPCYERNGVTIDRCTECGGIFLDRGELERLIDAEGQYNDARGWRDDERGRRDDERDWINEEGHQGRRRRRGSFIGDLLDFG